MKGPKKWVLIFILSISGSSYAQGLILEGKVSKIEVDSARSTAFYNLPFQIDATRYARLDPGMTQNLQAKVQRIGCLPDRRLSFFDNGSYSVSYFGQHEMLYYLPNGVLQKIEVMDKPSVPDPFDTPGHFPLRGAQYSAQNGALLRTTYRTGVKDFVFNPDQTVNTYCIGQNCYAPNGQFGYSRKFESACTLGQFSAPAPKQSTLKSAWEWWKSTAPQRNIPSPYQTPQAGYIQQPVYTVPTPIAQPPVFNPNPGVYSY